MVNAEIFSNAQMKKLIEKVFTKKTSVKLQELVYNHIYETLSSLKLNADECFTWLSFQNGDETSRAILSQYDNLTLYEWDNFEIYFDKKKINQKYAETTILIVNCFQSFLNQNNFSKAFCLIISVQKGRLGNINVRFHLFREGESCIKDINQCCQPVLYVLFTPCQTA